MYPKLKNFYYNFTCKVDSKNTIDKSKTIIIQDTLNKSKKYMDNFYKDAISTDKFSKIINLIDPFRTYKYNLAKLHNCQLINSTWLNIWEIINQFKLIPSKYSDQSYICLFNDSFGSIASVVNHYIKSMTTIKSFVWYACGENNKLNLYSSRWLGSSQMTEKNINSITCRLTEGVNLFISDISSGSTDYTLQELDHIKNNLGQCLLGLKTLARNGHMIIKMYTLFLEITNQLVFLLSDCFENIYINKPYSSKSANSDIFVVCINLNTEKVQDIIKTIERFIISGDYNNKLIEKETGYINLEEYYIPQNNILIDLINLYENITECNSSGLRSFDSIIKELKIQYKEYHKQIVNDWNSKYIINNLKYKDKLLIK